MIIEEYKKYYNETKYIREILQKKIQNYIEYNVDAPLRFCKKYLFIALAIARKENPKQLLFEWEDDTSKVINKLIEIDSQMQKLYISYLQKNMLHPLKQIKKDLEKEVKEKFNLA